MKTKREDSDSMGEEERGSKKQRVLQRSASPPPPLGFENPLLPLANTYNDDDEEEDYEQKETARDGGGKDNRIARIEQNGQGAQSEEYDEDEGEEGNDASHDQGVGQGRLSRQIEIRRDCPYLDTVNRQVIFSILLLKNTVFIKLLCTWISRNYYKLYVATSLFH